MPIQLSGRRLRMSASNSGGRGKKIEDEVSQRSHQDWATLLELVGDEGSLDDESIHGLMYLLKEGFNLPLSYEFRMRLFGPYSRELLEDVQLLTGHQVLVRLSGKYALGQADETRTILESLATEIRDAIGQMLKIIRAEPPTHRAVLPTMLLALKESNESDRARLREDVVRSVTSLRPSISRDEIQDAFGSLPTVASDSRL
jgi:uncharacterized protein YwgA